MSELPTPGPRKSRAFRLLAGGLIGNVLLTVMYFGLLLLLGESRHLLNNTIGVPSLFLFPVIGGVAAAWIWRSLDLPVSACLKHFLWMAGLSVVGAAAVLHEGAVCLVIGFPILWFSLFTGAALGRVWFKTDHSKTRLCIFPVLAILAASEPHTRTDQPAVVTDEVLIRASPEKVWPHVLAFPEIKEAPRYWIFRLGLPYPVCTTNGGNFVGADRQCIFSDGIVLKERVAELIPRERLTFDIVEQPTHPEAYGHITLHRGQFVLRDNGDGTTTLVGYSWYTLHVRPLWYFDWWTRDMTRAVHLRVMEHVKKLAETSA